LKTKIAHDVILKAIFGGAIKSILISFLRTREAAILETPQGKGALKHVIAYRPEYVNVVHQLNVTLGA